MLRKWLSELEVDEQDARTFNPQRVDSLCLEMASVHSHLILCLRNVTPKELLLEDVRQLLLSYMFLQRRHVWNRQAEPPAFQLPVSEQQIFDIMQAKRRAIVEWLSSREDGESARAVQHLLHEVFETGTGDLNHVTVWARYNGTVNAGRYATVTFHVLGAGVERPQPPPYVRRVADRDPQVEVNLQLLQVMMRGRFLTALQQDFMKVPPERHLNATWSSPDCRLIAIRFPTMTVRLPPEWPG